ncbi:MAG: hypothetical protein DMD55_18690, partial [Gemmatimonadetes bacterium]
MTRTSLVALRGAALGAGLAACAAIAPAQRIASALAKRGDTSDFATRAVRYRLVQEQLETSYITVLGGGGNIEKLFFEADVAPHFSAGWSRWALVVTSKIVLRMRNDSTHSAPIRTPSYMPRIAAYWWGPFRGGNDHGEFVSFTISHHSNGQAGPFF